MSDITSAIAPKSDQLNADDLISGPRTIKITAVKVLATPEQPIWVSFEGDNGRPWKPCKTAARCLALIWGPQSAQWIGMSCTIYNDPTVTWGGASVGGIRVSHMEGIDAPRQLQLTKTRGKKSAVVIQPLRITPAPQIDIAAVQTEARTVAAKGKAAFVAWWKDQPQPTRAAVKPIMDELSAASAKFDNEQQKQETNDEPPL